MLDELSFEGIVKYIKDGKAKNIVTMAGAGISTSAGIPDFRCSIANIKSDIRTTQCSSTLQESRVRFIRQPAEVQPPAPSGHLRDRLLPGEPDAVLQAGQGALSGELSSDAVPLLHPPSGGEGPPAAALHSEHRHPGAGGRRRRREAGRGARHVSLGTLHRMQKGV